MLLITLCYCKHFLCLSKIAQEFKLSRSYANKIIADTIECSYQKLYYYFCPWQNRKFQLEKNFLFEKFPASLGSVDVTVQEISRPKKNQHIYYSGKHHYHCVKTQVMVSPNGCLSHSYGPVAGSVHDLQVFRMSDLPSMLKKEREDYAGLDENGPLLTVLMDKAYQGSQNIIEGTIFPFKGRNLTHEQKEFNKNISHDRII